ncbi:cytochrome b [Haloferax sulfurifontis]|uniref:Cytochrome B6 n=1 Tax=Haloferax sulfurifontis ATCC BAA-897 TaxID=662480 RepID=M0I6J3_9EURY|nr:cytochrome bc complex cytochrome b subunit [Haloferax sulfurifontis]ELZ91029.1 cytochrome B6 [Haloferax sulfurifontis ATCC BAA-897]
MTRTAPDDGSGDDRPDARPDGGEADADLPGTDLTVRTHEAYPRNALFDWLDQRLELDHTLLGKAFPEDDYGSFLLGEIALFTFVILGLTGTFLGLLYNPAVNSVTYEGNALQYADTEVPAAFASVLHITYDTTFGMFARMMHHWAAYLFIAAIALHMFRVFFTGAYRNPHEPNWFIGSTLLLFALVEGFFGYALPYDNFSKTATTIGFQMTGTIPGVGSFLQSLVFGGAFPAGADQVIPRMFFLHVFLIPAALVGAIALHMAVLMRQKHTEHAPSSRGEGRPDDDDDSVVVGMPLFPQQFLVSTIVFLLTAATVAFLAGFFPVQRIAAIGPATPTSTPSHVGPDWFFMWVFGSLKMMPSWLGEWGRFAGGVVVPSLIIGVMMIWPLLDNPEHPVHFTADPLDRPLQTALGVAAVMLIIVLSIDGMRATVAAVLGVSDAVLYPWLAALTVGMPIFDFAVVYWLLKRRKRRKSRTGTAG